MKLLKVLLLIVLFMQSSLYAGIGGTRGKRSYKYAVLMTKSTYNDPEWKKVADTLLSIHGKTDSKLFTYNWDPAGAKSALSIYMPDYIAIVGKGVSDINKTTMRSAYKMVRNLDSDPYPDAVLGFVTGYEAADAMRSVTTSLRLKTGLHSTPGKELHISTGEVNREPIIKYIDFEKDTLKGSNIGADRTLFLADMLNNGVDVTVNGKQYKQPIDIFGTGGHGNENAWQIHYPSASPEGYFRSNAGDLIAAPNQGATKKIIKNTPTVYLSINNCLIGNPDNINNMVYAWFHSGYLLQMYGMIENCRGAMHGPTVSKKLQYAGYNPIEAFFMSETNLIWAKETATDKSNDSKEHNIGNWPMWQINHNLDDGVMYGDPKADVQWEEGDGSKFYAQGLDIELKDSIIDANTIMYELKMTKNIAPSTHGAPRYATPSWKRDERPVVPLPNRIDVSTIEIIEDDSYDHLILDNVVLVDAWRKADYNLPDGTVKVFRWKAKTMGTVSNIADTKKGNTSLTKTSIALNDNRLSVQFSNKINNAIDVRIVDAKGRNVYNHRENTSQAINHMDIALPIQISPGTYIVQLTGEGLLFNQKVIIK